MGGNGLEGEEERRGDCGGALRAEGKGKNGKGEECERERRKKEEQVYEG